MSKLIQNAVVNGIEIVMGRWLLVMTAAVFLIEIVLLMMMMRVEIGSGM